MKQEREKKLEEIQEHKKKADQFLNEIVEKKLERINQKNEKINVFLEEKEKLYR